MKSPLLAEILLALAMLAGIITATAAITLKIQSIRAAKPTRTIDAMESDGSKVQIHFGPIVHDGDIIRRHGDNPAIYTNFCPYAPTNGQRLQSDVYNQQFDSWPEIRHRLNAIERNALYNAVAITVTMMRKDATLTFGEYRDEAWRQFTNGNNTPFYEAEPWPTNTYYINPKGSKP